MGCGLAVLMGAFLVAGPGEPAEARATEFETWFHAATVGELELPGPITLKAREFRYVFVGGYRNERMPGYFSQNMAELRSLGVPRSAIHVIQPSSSQSSEENAGEVRARFLEIADRGEEKLVVIAHSRGACDALAFAMANAAFVRDRVEALFLIQGPFGGSGVAEYVLGRGRPMDRKMPWRQRIVGHLLGKVARTMARRAGFEALEEMTREASRAFWSKTLEKYADAVATVGPKVFYVRSSIHPSRLHFARRAIAWYLQIYHGPGDGMVALADQALPAVGTVIATIEAGHADLTHRFPASRAGREMRRALIRSIVMAVGRPSAPVEVREDAARAVKAVATAVPPS